MKGHIALFSPFHSLQAWRTLPPAGAPIHLRHVTRAMRSFFSPKYAKNIERNLHKQLSQTFSTAHICLNHSGRSGLALALKSLYHCLSQGQKTRRTEVLIPAYVSYSVPSAVVNAGFTVRLYDIDPKTLAPNYDSMAAACTEKTLAIILCHQFGLPFDASPAYALAQQMGAYLVDDAAQAMGATIQGQSVGTMGHVGIFSLSRGKPLTAVEGGIVLTNHKAIATAMHSVAEDMYTPLSSWEEKTLDAKTALKAAALMLLRRPLFYTIPASLPFLRLGASIFAPHFPHGPLGAYSTALTKMSLGLLTHTNNQRCQKAALYDNMLQKYTVLQRFPVENGAEAVYLRYALRPHVGHESLVQKLFTHDAGRTARKFGISRGFPQSLARVESLKPFLAPPIKAQEEESFLGAQYLAENLFTLPTHDQVQVQDIQAMDSFFAHIFDGRESL